MRFLPISGVTILFAALLLPAIVGAQSADTPPFLIYRSEPEYSAEATRARVQSTVVLSIVVGEDGKARDVHVAQGAGFGLDEKAIEAMDKWRFNPGTHDGHPTATPAQVEMNFTILAKNDRLDHSGQRARLNFTLPPDTTRPELVVGALPGNPAGPGEQSLRFHLQVDALGVPKSVTVLTSNDPAWEKQVLRVVQTWRFRPATINGTAVLVEGVFEIEHSGPPEAPVPLIVQTETDDASVPVRHVPAPLPVPGLIARSNHAATLLNNGTVLLAGGLAPGPAPHELSSAQTFDWATRAIAGTGSMLAARRYHSATLLKDGTVLIAGGEAGGKALASAEIFDPSTGRFSPTGSMHEARRSQVAALLPDGRVLVCGGAADPSTTEIYDPRSKSFRPSGRMTAPRTSFSAVVLKDGRVLLAGGGTADAEIFDPESGAFSATGSMIAARAAFSATLLNDGQALIAGGAAGSGAELDTAEIFDPATGRFRATGPMAASRARHVAVLLSNGKVLITGGSGDGPPAQTEVYDPAAATFSPGPMLASMHVGHTATLLENGSVLVAGSSVADQGDSAELLTAP
jgi:TonB family protein